MAKQKNFLRILLKWFSYLIAFVLVLVAIAYSIAAVNEQKILEAINKQLKTVIDGEVKIGDLRFTLFEDFPTFSLSFSDIYIRDHQYAKYKQDLLNAERIYVDIQPLQLLTGTISLRSIKIRNANVFIFRAADGYTNLNAFKKNEKKDTSKRKGFKPTIDLQKIIFENTRLTYFDSIKRKSYGLNFSKTDVIRTLTDSSRQLSIVGGIQFTGMMLKEEKGSYLLNKATIADLNLEIIEGVPGFVLKPSTLQFVKSTVELSGIFKFQAPGSFVLNIHSPNLDYAEGTTIVTKALEGKLGKYNLSDPIDLKVKLDGSLAGGEPKIDMEFSTTNNQLHLGKLEVVDLNFKGAFINHVDSTVTFGDPNSRLSFENFSGRVSGVPTEGKVSITNLKDPELNLDSHMKLTLTDLNGRTDTTRIKFKSGIFTADVSYQGKLKEYLDSTRTSYEGKLLGKIKVEGAAWGMPAQQKDFDQAEVAIQFTSSKMDIEKANFTINNSPVEIKGSLSGFIPFFFGPEKKGSVDLSIYSKRLDLTPLIKKKVKPKQQVAKTKGGQKISDFLDMLYEKIEFNLAIKIDELVKGPLRATNFVGKAQLHNGNLKAGPVTMKTADGTVSLSLQINNLDKPENDVRILTEVKNVDIKKFFKSFDNFSQKAITSDHLSGKLSNRVQLKGKVDDQFKVLLPSLSGTVDFRLVDGKLQNYEPMQKLSNFLFKNRDFSKVEFAEIRSKMKINGSSIDIERMEIQSSVLFMFIEGRYSLEDSTALSIQIPLKNLKKRDANYKPENVGTDAKVGASIFLFVHKKDGKTVISYDPFKKHRKKSKS